MIQIIAGLFVIALRFAVGVGVIYLAAIAAAMLLGGK